MVKSLVLGANGFMGSHLSEYLAGQGHSVACFDRFRNGITINARGALRDRIKIVRGNFRKVSELERALDGVDYVFHFVSSTSPYTSISNPEIEIDESLSSTVNLLKSCVKKKVKKIIFPSSGGLIYGSAGSHFARVSERHLPLPLLPHAIIKLTIERFLHFFYEAYGLDFCVLRLCNVYGPKAPLEGDQGVVTIFMNAILNHKRPVIFGRGTAVRDYLYITDAVRAVALSATKPTREKIFNVGSGKGYTTLSLFEKIRRICKKKIKPIFRAERGLPVWRIVLDATRFKKEFGWKPEIEIDSGLSKIFDWMNHS